MYKPLELVLPEVARAETRSVTIPRQGYLETFAFVEAFCTEEGCDCRRAFIFALSEDDPVPVATIGYGWENASFYVKWMHGDRTARELAGARLEPGHRQGKSAERALEAFRMALQQDRNYGPRIQRHYEQFRAAIAQAPRKQASAGRNGPCPCGSGKKYKKCCIDNLSDKSINAIEAFRNLPAARGIWIGMRRKLPVVVESTPQGVDLGVWMEEDTHIVRAHDVVPSGEAPDALDFLLLKAMNEPMSPASPARPRVVVVAEPGPNLEKYCNTLGIRITIEDFTDLLDEIMDGAVSERQLEYLLPGFQPQQISEFFAKMSDFGTAAPWRHMANSEAIRLEGLDVSPLHVVVLGNGGIEEGAVMCLTDAALQKVASGAEIDMEGAPENVLFLAWVDRTEVAADVREQVKKYRWKTHDDELLPMMMSLQRTPDTRPTPEEMRLACGALEAITKLSFSSRTPVDQTLRLSDGRPVSVQWPIDAMPEKRNAGGKWLQFRVELLGSAPEIWRRIVVSEQSTLLDLHFAIQGAMGWEDDHEWGFERNKEYFVSEDADRVILSELGLRKRSKIKYVYDFGDEWVHELVLEDRPTGVKEPACVDGAGACPPEDCGGIYRYNEKLAKRQSATKFSAANATKRMRSYLS